VVFERKFDVKKRGHECVGILDGKALICTILIKRLKKLQKPLAIFFVLVYIRINNVSALGYMAVPSPRAGNKFKGGN